MKRTCIAAALLACTAVPAIAADDYYAPGAPVVLAPAEYYYQDPDTILAVQQQLLARGYTVPIDGVFDFHTIDALKAFQLLQGFTPTGIIDQPTLTVLQVNGMPATIRRASLR